MAEKKEADDTVDVVHVTIKTLQLPEAANYFVAGQVNGLKNLDEDAANLRTEVSKETTTTPQFKKSLDFQLPQRWRKAAKVVLVLAAYGVVKDEAGKGSAGEKGRFEVSLTTFLKRLSQGAHVEEGGKLRNPEDKSEQGEIHVALHLTTESAAELKKNAAAPKKKKAEKPAKKNAAAKKGEKKEKAAKDDEGGEGENRVQSPKDGSKEDADKKAEGSKEDPEHAADKPSKDDENKDEAKGGDGGEKKSLKKSAKKKGKKGGEVSPRDGKGDVKKDADNSESEKNPGEEEGQVKTEAGEGEGDGAKPGDGAADGKKPKAKEKLKKGTKSGKSTPRKPKAAVKDEGEGGGDDKTPLSPKAPPSPPAATEPEPPGDATAPEAGEPATVAEGDGEGEGAAALGEGDESKVKGGDSLGAEGVDARDGEGGGMETAAKDATPRDPTAVQDLGTTHNGSGSGSVPENEPEGPRADSETSPPADGTHVAADPSISLEAQPTPSASEDPPSAPSHSHDPTTDALATAAEPATSPLMSAYNEGDGDEGASPMVVPSTRVDGEAPIDPTSSQIATHEAPQQPSTLPAHREPSYSGPPPKAHPSPPHPFSTSVGATPAVFPARRRSSVIERGASAAGGAFTMGDLPPSPRGPPSTSARTVGSSSPMKQGQYIVGAGLGAPIGGTSEASGRSRQHWDVTAMRVIQVMVHGAVNLGSPSAIPSPYAVVSLSWPPGETAGAGRTMPTAATGVCPQTRHADWNQALDLTVSEEDVKAGVLVSVRVLDQTGSKQLAQCSFYAYHLLPPRQWSLEVICDREHNTRLYISSTMAPFTMGGTPIVRPLADETRVDVGVQGVVSRLPMVADMLFAVSAVTCSRADLERYMACLQGADSSAPTPPVVSVVAEGDQPLQRGPDPNLPDRRMTVAATDTDVPQWQSHSVFFTKFEPATMSQAALVIELYARRKPHVQDASQLPSFPRAVFTGLAVVPLANILRNTVDGSISVRLSDVKVSFVHGLFPPEAAATTPPTLLAVDVSVVGLSKSVVECLENDGHQATNPMPPAADVYVGSVEDAEKTRDGRKQTADGITADTDIPRWHTLHDDMKQKNQLIERLLRETDERESVVRKCGLEILALRKENTQLAEALRGLKDRISQDEAAAAQGLPEAYAGLSQEELTSKLLSLSNALRREKSEKESVQARLASTLDQLLRCKDAERKLSELKESHIQQSEIVQRLRAEGSVEKLRETAAKATKLQATVEKQEQVIERLEALLKGSVESKRECQAEKESAMLAFVEGKSSPHEQVELMRGFVKSLKAAHAERESDLVARIAALEKKLLSANGRVEMEAFSTDSSPRGKPQGRRVEVDSKSKTQDLSVTDRVDAVVANISEASRTASDDAAVRVLKVRLENEERASEELRQRLRDAVDRARAVQTEASKASAAKRASEEEQLRLRVRADKAEARATALQQQLASNAKRFASEIAQLKIQLAERQASVLYTTNPTSGRGGGGGGHPLGIRGHLPVSEASARPGAGVSIPSFQNGTVPQLPLPQPASTSAAAGTSAPVVGMPPHNGYGLPQAQQPVPPRRRPSPTSQPNVSHIDATGSHAAPNTFLRQQAAGLGGAAMTSNGHVGVYESAGVAGQTWEKIPQSDYSAQNYARYPNGFPVSGMGAGLPSELDLTPVRQPSR